MKRFYLPLSLLAIVATGCSQAESNCASVQSVAQKCSDAEKELLSLKSAKERQDFLMACVNASPRSQSELKEVPGLGLLETIRTGASLLSVQFLKVVFDHDSDVMPLNRKKFIHTYGSTAEIEFVPTSHSKFTGLYKGAVGILRASVATSPTANAFTPGISIKFQVEGQSSQNIMLMNSTDGQGNDWNFFAKPFTNNIPKGTSFASRFIDNSFSKAKNDGVPTHLPVNQLAEVTQEGVKEDISIAPTNLVIEPEKSVAWPGNSRKDFRLHLGELQPGVVLYKVYAADKNNKKESEIGSIVLKQKFVPSVFGDEKMFFRHPQ